MWQVEFAPAAVRALDRLPTKIAAAVVEFCTTTLPTNPRRMTKPLRYELEGWHVARRGDYRVFVEIRPGQGQEQPSADEPGGSASGVLVIGRIEHRAHAYRPRG